MKNFKLFAIVAILGTFTLTSCGEDEIAEPINQKSDNSINSKTGGGGGGEDEEPIIIYGLTKDVLNNPIENASVNLYNAANNQLVNTDLTDGNGNFEFSELAGTYYFIVNASGYLSYQSADLSLPLNNGINFTLQQE